MSTIVTRVYQDQFTADQVASALLVEEFASRDVSVVAGGDAGNTAGRLRDLGVAEDVASAAGDAVASGHAALVVKAPFGKALKAKKIVDRTNSIDLGIEKTDGYTSSIKTEKPNYVLSDHPLFLTSKSKGGASPDFQLSSLLGFPLLSKRRPGKKTVYKGGKHIFGRNNLTSQRFGADCKGNHEHTISRLLRWQTISHSRLNSEIDQDNPTPFSSAMGWDLISRR